MVAECLRTLLNMMDVLRPAFTQPGFQNAVVVLVGWVLTGGPHAITQALVATDVARRRHHEAFHRFFSRGTWRPDDVGLLLFERLMSSLPSDTPIRAVIDDTLAEKKGPNIFGIGSHLDAVRSTKACRIFCFGHVWVTLAVVVSVPFSRRPWALPVMFRLYRNKKTCATKGHVYRKKTELARDMLEIFAKWAAQREVHLAMDAAYCNDTVLRNLPVSITVFGAMRPDAVLTGLPRLGLHRNGRPRVRGKLRPKPEALARNARREWQTCEADLYGRRRIVHYKTICAQWYRACGTRMLRVVVVRVDDGRIRFRVFFSTNTEMNVSQILETYAGRWGIEVCFRDLKQLLGFADSSARKREAVERTAPFVGYIYTLLVIWFLEGAHHASIAVPPIRPWYRHKRGFCFADILRAAQRVLVPLDVLDPTHSLDNLQKLSPRRERAARTAPREAA